MAPPAGGRAQAQTPSPRREESLNSVAAAEKQRNSTDANSKLYRCNIEIPPMHSNANSKFRRCKLDIPHSRTKASFADANSTFHTREQKQHPLICRSVDGCRCSAAHAAAQPLPRLSSSSSSRRCSDYRGCTRECKALPTQAREPCCNSHILLLSTKPQTKQNNAKQANKQTNKTSKQSSKQTKQTNKQANKQANKQTNSQANTQTDTQTDRRTDRQTDININVTYSIYIFGVPHQELEGVVGSDVSPSWSSSSPSLPALPGAAPAAPSSVPLESSTPKRPNVEIVAQSTGR